MQLTAKVATQVMQTAHKSSVALEDMPKFASKDIKFREEWIRKCVVIPNANSSYATWKEIMGFLN